jgi:hypothetical protein
MLRRTLRAAWIGLSFALAGIGCGAAFGLGAFSTLALGASLEWAVVAGWAGFMLAIGPLSSLSNALADIGEQS